MIEVINEHLCDKIFIIAVKDKSLSLGFIDSQYEKNNPQRRNLSCYC